MFDVGIIGCGIVGASMAWALSRYQVSVLVLEKENDVANRTTKANSAIVHAGYDPEPGTLMARLNVRGSAMIQELCADLDVEYRQAGSFVLAFCPEDEKTLQILLERGLKNGVPGIRIISGAEARKLEPNLSQAVTAALYAPSAAIVCPWELCIAMAETAVKNGVRLELESGVTAITALADGGYHVVTEQGEYDCRFLVNAAGLHAEEVCRMVAEPEFHTLPNRGEYYMMDKSQGDLVSRVIFQCPTKEGKGVLVSPTVHGNLIVGPNAQDIDSGNDTSTTTGGLEFVKRLSQKSVPGINFRESIRNFAGVRAVTDQPDFIIAESKTAKGFLNLAGIKSPGLSSAPAIAEMAVELLEGMGLTLHKKEVWDGTRTKIRFKELSPEEKSALIQRDPHFGRVICRCETITEGEILQALRSPIVPRTIDGVKRRCNAGMGRCQGGFCGPRVQELIAKELNLPIEQVLQDRAGSYLLTGRTKGM